MTVRRWTLWFVCVCAISALVGCGGGSSSGGGTPPPAISVTLSTAPPASLEVNQTASVAATVANDSSNAGVDWSCAPSGSCGSFNPAHTASGTSTTYTAPSAAPSGNKVTITATSTTDKTKSAAGTTTISVPTVAFNPALPSSLSVNQTNTPLTAVVSSDTEKKGVDWSCSPVGTCGSFSPTHTASGAATMYTAPASATTARIKAVATADPSQSAIGNITIYGVSIGFYPQPTPSLLLSDTNPTSITAVVQHDVSNAGVDWACSGATNVCGTLGQPHTASGVANTYTLSGTNVVGAATITATSTADPTKVATAIITSSATFQNSTLSGNYVFQLSGINANGPYRVVGTLVTDGNGNVTGGEQNYVFLSSTTGFTSYHDTFTAAAFTAPIGTDGRGQIALNTGDTNVGVGGIETLGIVVIDGTKALITEFDGSATSSGTLDLQTPKSQLAGGYAFVTSGINGAGKPLGFGGIFNIDNPGTGTISGKGSITDEIVGTNVNTAQTLSGTIVSPDQYGKVVINLTAGFTAPNVGLALVGYVIDDTHVRFVEQDHFGVTGGTAYGQGTATGTFNSGSFNTAAVFGTEGLSTTSFVPTVYAGLFTAGSGSINGVADENVSGGTPITDATLTGTYAVDSSGTGRVTTSLTFNGNPGPSWVLYLTGDANTPALILQLDAAPIETAGAVYTQTVPGGGFTASSFNLNYAMNFTAYPSATSEDDGEGQAVADGVSTLAGTMDTNYNMASQNTEGLAGGFGAVANGRFTGTLTEGTVFSTTPVSFYIVDSTRVVFIETDSVQPALGIFRLQEQ
jgi:hypothetical protein